MAKKANNEEKARYIAPETGLHSCSIIKTSQIFWNIKDQLTIVICKGTELQLFTILSFHYFL